LRRGLPCTLRLTVAARRASTRRRRTFGNDRSARDGDIRKLERRETFTWGGWNSGGEQQKYHACHAGLLEENVGTTGVRSATVSQKLALVSSG
jgi:hypothetical protein